MATSKRTIGRGLVLGTALFATLALACAAIAHDPPHAPRYELIDLGTLGGEHSRALGMNEDGTVVGWSTTALHPTGPPTRAFIRYPSRPMEALPALSEGPAEARDINSFDQVVGVYTVDGERHGIYWYEGAAYDLNDVVDRVVMEYSGRSPLDPPLCTAPLRHIIEANAINDVGEIVVCGYLYSDENVHGFLLKPRPPHNPVEPFYDVIYLGELPEALDCITYGINVLGETVGTSGGDAFVWRDGIRALDDRELVSEGRSINYWGTIVGWTGPDEMQPTAAMWQNDHRFDLGVGGGWVSQATGIGNNSGLIVGWAALDMGHPREAILWEGCIPLFLNTTTSMPDGWSHMEEASAIDDMGRIIGIGRTNDGHARAFLLVPYGNFVPDQIAPR